MLADFRFITSDHHEVAAKNVEVRDLDHAAHRLAATYRKHPYAYAFYGFVYLNGKTYRVEVNRGQASDIVEIA